MHPDGSGPRTGLESAQRCCPLTHPAALHLGWQCPSCGVSHDRDINASRNILAAGLAVPVCGATLRPEQSKSVKAGAMKQKPRS
ncbi:MAG: zinc ribbon domain-containing protein [Prochlorotrichaceae cyanobacterium]